MTQTTIHVEMLREMLVQGQPVTVLDIRPLDERTEWAIPTSVHADVYHALKSEQPNALATLDLPKDRPVVTICAAGQTSRIAAQQLRVRGFDARSLVGGMKAWSLAWNHAQVPLPDSKA